jgi:hypothetical protein
VAELCAEKGYRCFDAKIVISSEQEVWYFTDY